MVGVVVEAILFGLFTMCMLCDQWTTVLTAQSAIDRFKGEGKELAKLYLGAAGGVFGNASSGQGQSSGGGLQYPRQSMSGDSAMLEFEATMQGKYVNGVDIIRCNAEGKIAEFKVLLRPLQAVNLVHQQMQAMLEKMKSRS